MSIQAAIPILLLLSLLVAACGCSMHAGMTEADARTWAGARVAPPSLPLDGRSFRVDLGRKGEGREETEVVEFAGGRFHSPLCDAYGFGSGAYTTRALPGGGLEFEATCTSTTDGTNVWRGVVRDRTIEGTLTWSKPGEAAVEHWLRGSEAAP